MFPISLLSRDYWSRLWWWPLKADSMELRAVHYCGHCALHGWQHGVPACTSVTTSMRVMPHCDIVQSVMPLGTEAVPIARWGYCCAEVHPGLRCCCGVPVAYMVSRDSLCGATSGALAHPISPVTDFCPLFLLIKTMMCSLIRISVQAVTRNMKTHDAASRPKKSCVPTGCPVGCCIPGFMTYMDITSMVPMHHRHCLSTALGAGCHP